MKYSYRFFHGFLFALPVLLTMACSPKPATYRPDLLADLEAVRALPMVATNAIGYGGTASEFSIMVDRIRPRVTVRDLELMVEDPHPYVRILAAVCLYYDKPDGYEQLVAPLHRDRSGVVYMSGCIGYEPSVSEVVDSIKESPGSYVPPRLIVEYLPVEILRRLAAEDRNRRTSKKPEPIRDGSGIF